jgi:plasmid stabilization system protein ParE
MTYRIVLTRRAKKDLNEAYLWCAERAPDTAIGWYNGLIDALHSLANNPELCSLAAEAKTLSMNIRQLLYGRRRNYRILFVLRKQSVVILHVRHAARHEAAHEDLF